MKAKQMVCPACGNEEINEKMKKCPKCGFKLPKPIYKKWWFWTVIVIGVLIIAGAGSNSGSGSSTNNSREYSKVEIQQMIDDLDENALKAENTYKNAYVEITGKIANFDSSGSYITVEAVNAGEWNLDTIMCYIKNEEQLKYLLEKSKGDRVTIKGKIVSVGEFLGYSLDIDSIE